MIVDFLCRRNLHNLNGGDVTQILQTKASLEKLGVTVNIVTEFDPRSECDLVHVFNPSLVDLLEVRAYRSAGKRIVVSTIYWDMEEYFRSFFNNAKAHVLRGRPQIFFGAISFLKGVFYLYARLSQIRAHMRAHLELCDLALPNSHAEAELLERLFGFPVEKIAVVYNASNLAPGDGGAIAKKPMVLCAGRIEPRKNQHILVEACRELGVELWLVGKAKDASYVALCKKSAQDSACVRFFEEISQDELRSFYAQAKVHALISWYETPGLSTLEALSFGCQAVVSRGGCTEEYFGDAAQYCDPRDLASVKDAIRTSLARKDAPRAKISITWDDAARETQAAYRRLLS